MFHNTIESLLNAATIDAIRASSVATCELLDPEASGTTSVPLTPPRDLTPEQCSQLKGLLLDPRSWFIVKKRCMPRQTAMFCLRGNLGEVRILVDSCCGWIVTGPTERTGSFFDPVAGPMQELLKSLFPEFASQHLRSVWWLRSAMWPANPHH